ncbi:uncharacterized protein LOC112088442 [Eutrema salsugineum]|uniref:uncharacterized protein LOC112088442 n=1 Tax=Eutrema salsugineum TaxID=72664 RepID=UPI000CECE452|nr:uncharacterized protein LOC112088442 [Eutrema salsugineum]
MENALALVHDDVGVWRDQDGHVCNERGQRLDGEGNIIRTLGDYNRPEQFYANRSSIRAPAFQRNDFELKPVYYTLVGQHPFHGHSHEHPMDHIERFEDLLEPGSLTTWEETRNSFLHNFFNDARSEELRTKISTFSQEPTEAFKASWVRFKSYQRDCPHHGFSDVQLLGIFFRGVDWRYQMALDAASNGNFNTRYPEDVVVLIENLASSNSTKNADSQRRKQDGNMDGSQIAEVKAKLDSVHSLLVGKKSVRFEPDEEAEQEDVNFINGTGFQGQRFGTQSGNMNYNGNNQKSTFTGNQNSSGYNSNPQYQTSYSNNRFSRNYGSPPPQTPDNEMKSMLEQILEGQQKITVDFNGKIDALYLDLNGKFEARNTHVKKLDIQVAQTAEAVKRQEGFLPGKTDTNPRHYCSAITLRSGRKLTPELKKGVSEDEIVELEESAEDFKTAEPVSSDTTTSVARHQVEDTKKAPAVSSDTTTSVERHQPPSEEIITKKPKPAEERVYKPKIPYPRSPKSSKQELDDARCKALMEKLVSAVIQNKMPEKLSDPGSFVLDCSIFSERFKRSLCDLGSSVNLMPYSVAVNLGMTDFKPTKISLILADRSKRIPKDFVVLEYGEEPKDPLILGRSFLAIAGAVIDVKHGNLDLHLGDTIMTFKMEKLKDSTIDGQTFQVSAIPEVIVGDPNVFDAEKVRDQPELTKTSTEPVTAVDQEAHNIMFHSSPPMQRSRSPKHRSHPGAIPAFLGRPHAHNAYTPPWMRRLSQRHSLSLSDPPDA